MIMMFNIIEGPTTLPLNSSKSSNVYYYEACSPCLQLNWINVIVMIQEEENWT